MFTPGSICTVNDLEIQGSKLLAAVYHGFYFSTDVGISWMPANTGLLTTNTWWNITSVATHGNTIFIATDHGTFISEDGISWKSMDLNADVHDLAVNDTHIFAATAVGVFRRPISEVINGVETVMNAPNIKFYTRQGRHLVLENLPRERITVDVYNINGSKILSDLVDTPKDNFDLSDQAPGMYFYKVFSKDRHLASGKFLIE
jgi:hypothetical protein